MMKSDRAWSKAFVNPPEMFGVGAVPCKERSPDGAHTGRPRATLCLFGALCCNSGHLEDNAAEPPRGELSSVGVGCGYC